jgi:hypothetical protein
MHMRLQDVPPSTVLAATADKTNLRATLDSFLASASKDAPTQYFRSFEPIEGAPWSGRIVYLEPQERGVKLPSPTDASGLAEDIYLLTQEARYPRLRIGDYQSKKGWEIRETYVQGTKALILYPAWVQ